MNLVLRNLFTTKKGLPIYESAFATSFNNNACYWPTVIRSGQYRKWAFQLAFGSWYDDRRKPETCCPLVPSDVKMVALIHCFINRKCRKWRYNIWRSITDPLGLVHLQKSTEWNVMRCLEKQIRIMFLLNSNAREGIFWFCFKDEKTRAVFILLLLLLYWYWLIDID